ncbi:hypothetical protein ACFPRA_22735 [Sporosarcina soli]|uniref:Zinc ribbon domain-containing protein n=1 Tax=Sporosarcina soli TaxID=334736 RepID=A0ABW0TQ96_9BACL
MKEYSKSCPNCQRFKHEDEAVFCIVCGTKLKNGDLRKFYLSLKVPEHKITWERNRIGKFLGCPFFLRKIDNANHLLQVITLHEFPKGNQSSVRLPARSRAADWTEEIVLTKNLIHDLLNQGFEWFHESEMDTLW